MSDLKAKQVPETKVISGTFLYEDDDNIWVGAGRTIENCPIGTHPAVCVDVVSLGVKMTQYEGQPEPRAVHKIQLVWQVFPRDGSRQTDGDPFIVEGQFTASLNPKAILRNFLEQWRGRLFTPAEVKGFNLTTIKGAPCWLTVDHAQVGNSTFANAIAAEPYVDDNGNRITDPKKLPKASNYVRRDYTGWNKPKATAETTQTINGADQTPASYDDGVPF